MYISISNEVGMNIDFSQLQALEAVFKEASFQRAAEKLFLTQSAISQRIRAFEDSVGQPLLIRSTPPTLTNLGQKYVSVFEQIKALIYPLQNKEGTQKTKLSVVSNTECFDIWFNQCLIEFSKEEEVLFDVRLHDQDHTLSLLKDARVLAGISAEEKPIQGCVAYKLKKQHYVCVAHREYAKKHGLHQGAKDKILKLPTTIYDSLDLIHDNFLKTLLKTKKVPPYVAHTIPSVTGMLQHINAQSVFAVMPLEMVEGKIKTGEFVNLFPQVKMTSELYWHTVQTEIPILKKLTRKILDKSGAT